MEYIITEQYKKWRLDKYLTQQLNQSRNQVQKMIQSGQVLVNNVKPSTHCFLKINDMVKINEKQLTSGQKVMLPKVEAKLLPAPSLLKRVVSLFNKSKSRLKINYLAENQDYFIIEKPSGLLVHPTLRQEKETLVDLLLKKHPELSKIGENPARPAIVHRLDKEVSGLMIIPRSLDAFDYFKKQFKLRRIKKEYTALVHGSIDKDSGEIDFPITRSKAGKFVALPKNSEQGKPAVTEFKVMKRFQNYTLLKVKPLTGRTNQIRVHLTAIDHPIIGDPLYQAKKTSHKLKTGRIFLHATKLSFEDLQGKKQTFVSEIPKELKSFLSELKS